MEQDRGVPPEGAAEQGEGTAAVLYAIFTSFTESLGDLEHRLTAIEASVRDTRAELAGRLDDLGAAVQDRPAAAPATGVPTEALVDLVNQRAEGLERRFGELEGALESLRAVIQAHADETSHSLGRRAGDMGRRLASDLGLTGRRTQPGGGR